MNVYAAQSLTAFYVAEAIILFIPVVFNSIFHTPDNVGVTAASVQLIAFVYVKAPYALVAVVVGCFLKDNVFIHHVAVLLECK